MTISFRPPAPNVGRFTALILGFVVFVCVAMIGGTGYLKYQMDRAETLLAAPDSAVGSDQEMFDRLRRVLGYGGYLGLAQNYATKHDASGFAEMKADIKSADEIVSKLPDRTPAETRHDLTSIVSIFDTSLQQLNAPANGNNEFTVENLMPLYAAMPVLDTRIASTNAETRLGAENQMHFWGMLLTLVSWCSLIIAAACAAGIYLTLRDKHSAPMRALAQSIQNMARGDMRTAIWGTERQDQIGELARAVDTARYHFSHLPDLSLLSDQGPVRMRFEGGTRSLFEAMMKAISGDSENIRSLSAALTREVQDQRESIADLSGKVETVLRNILQNGQDGDRQITQAISDMVTSTENLKNAHGHAADQLNRLIPHIQDRATGMAEIAQITGKQVAQTLQSLTLSEMGMKANAEHAKDTLTKLSSTADDLGERLFGAINLLQASGKVLAETTENMQQGRMAEPATGSTAGESIPMAINTVALTPLVKRLEQVAEQLTDMQGKLGDQLDVQSKAATAQMGLLNTHSDDFMTQTATTVQTLSAAADHLRSGQSAFDDALAEIHAKLETLGKSMQQHAVLAAGSSDVNADLNLLSGFEQLIAERVEPKFAALEQSLGQKNTDTTGNLQAQLVILGHDIASQLQKEFDELTSSMGQNARALIDNGAAAAAQARQALDDMADRIAALAASLPGELTGSLQRDWQRLSVQLETAQSSIERNLEKQKADMFAQNASLSLQARDSVLGLGAKIATMADAIPSELRESMQADWQRLSAQMESAQSVLAETLDQQKRDIKDHNSNLSLQARDSIIDLGDRITSIAIALPVELRQNLHDDLERLSTQMDNARGAYEQILGDRLEPQLAALERSIAQQTQDIVAQTTAASSHARNTLVELSDKMAGIAHTLPPALRAQMEEDWKRLSTQIEQLRTGVGQMFAERLEPRLFTVERAITQQTRDIIDHSNNSMAASSAQARSAISEMGGKLTAFASALPGEVRQQLQEELDRLSAQIEGVRDGVGPAFAEQIDPKLVAIAQHIGQQARAILEHGNAVAGQTRSDIAEVADKFASLGNELGQQTRNIIEHGNDVATQTRGDIADVASKVASLGTELGQQTRNIIEHGGAAADQTRTEIAALGEKVIGIGQTIGQQGRALLDHGAAVATQARSDIAAVGEKVAGIGPVIIQHTRAILDQGAAIVGQTKNDIAAVGEKIVAMSAELGQQTRNILDQNASSVDQTRNDIVVISEKMAAIGAGLGQHTRAILDQGAAIVGQTRNDIATIGEKVASISADIGQQTRSILEQNTGLTSQTRGDIAALGEKLGEKLSGVGGDIEKLQDAARDTKEIAQASLTELEKPISRLSFTLPPELQQQMHDHWYQMAAQIEASRASLDKALKEQVADKMAAFTQVLDATRTMVHALQEETARPSKSSLGLSPELQKQMHDQWAQVAAQIEASRASLVDTISHQVEKMENRMAGKGGVTAVSRTASDYATQRQFEQQTQILSELVGALAALDTHMQQIQTEIHAAAK